MNDTELMIGRPDDRTLEDQLLAPLWHGHWLFRWPLWISGLGAVVLVIALTYTFVTGIGTWGNDIPVGWAFAITNFVWWIGIGHAGTFISAILYITQQRWRASINRLAEAMTLFAVVNAGLFPIAHMGRAWFFYWLTPYPATMGLWPQFRSSLTWDVAAISTYGTVSLLFWYLGLLPDLATARDAAPSVGRARIYGLFALGWRGSARHWRHHRAAYMVLAGLATALVVSVHSIVSLDFAIAKVPGWHSTIFPPFFVAGALLSGFAMVLILVVPLRRIMHLENVITIAHLEKIAAILLATGSIVGGCYLLEWASDWHDPDQAERYFGLVARPFGPLGWLYWAIICGNAILPQVFWLRRARRSPLVLMAVAVVVQCTMWGERFMIVVGSLQRDRLPSGWGGYEPTVVDVVILGGTLCLFAFLFLLFLRWVPAIPIGELKRLRRDLQGLDAEAAAPVGDAHAA